MTGEIIITHKYGWACSRKSEMQFEDKITRDANGRPLNTIRSKVIKINDIYNVEGEVKEGVKVDVIVKHDETGHTILMRGHATHKNKIHISTTVKESELEIKEIINNLKNRRT